MRDADVIPAVKVLRSFGLVAVVVLAACASSSGESATTTTGPARADVNPAEIRQFTIDGAEVWARSALAELPERATRVEFAVTVIDDGEGPEVCLSEVAASQPPQCSGPIVAGLTMGAWAQSLEGVTWGERNLTVSWPPVDGSVQLLDERPFASPQQRQRPPIELPDDCRDIETMVGPERLAEWAAQHPDEAGIVFVPEEETLGALQVAGDIEAARAVLREPGAEPCLVPVEYSQTELRRAQDAIAALRSDAFVASAGSGNIENRVTVDVAVADQTSVRRILEDIDDPGIVLFTSTATIIDGT